MADNNTKDTPLTPEQEAQLAKIFDKFEEKFVSIIKFDSIEKNSVIFFKVSNNNYQFLLNLPIIAKKYQKFDKSIF
jgi:hypothetical protein